MFSINKTQTIWLLLLCLTYHLNPNTCQSIEPGSCSQKCQKEISQENDTIPMESEGVNSPSLTCSCSSSCFVYGDCCYDSKFRVVGQISSLRKICLTLSGKAKYKVVSDCSSDWTGSSSFCSEGIGHLPPVTSRTSGITYANIHCAICNNDAEEIKTWNVHLKCCPEHDDLEDQTERHFVYRKGNLQSVIPDKGNGLRRRCICKFYGNSQNNSFTDALELRICKPNVEISKCSTTWTNNTIRNLCDSFLEPIFSEEKVYRNLHCAQCNYENLDAMRCWPAVIERMLSQGLSYTDIFNYCTENDLLDCLYFFSLIGSGRGRGRPFSSLMNINVQECVPETGRRCCDGERYDFRSKRCRKVN